MLQTYGQKCISSSTEMKEVILMESLRQYNVSVILFHQPNVITVMYKTRKIM